MLLVLLWYLTLQYLLLFTYLTCFVYIKFIGHVQPHIFSPSMYVVISEFQTVLHTVCGKYIPYEHIKCHFLDIIKYNDYACWSHLKNCEKRLIASSYLCPSVSPSAQNNSTPTGRIFMNMYSVFFENLSINFKFH